MEDPRTPLERLTTIFDRIRFYQNVLPVTSNDMENRANVQERYELALDAMKVLIEELPSGDVKEAAKQIFWLFRKDAQL